jgi:hypothetical protein
MCVVLWILGEYCDEDDSIKEAYDEIVANLGDSPYTVADKKDDDKKSDEPTMVTKVRPRMAEAKRQQSDSKSNIPPSYITRLERSDSSTEKRSDNMNNKSHRLFSRNSFSSSLRSSHTPPIHITNNLPLVSSLLAERRPCRRHLRHPDCNVRAQQE